MLAIIVFLDERLAFEQKGDEESEKRSYDDGTDKDDEEVRSGQEDLLLNTPIVLPHLEYCLVHNDSDRIIEN